MRSVRLSPATTDAIREVKGMDSGELYVHRDSDGDSETTAVVSKEGLVGGDTERGKELEPRGLHCCSAGDYDWQADSFHLLQQVH